MMDSTIAKGPLASPEGTVALLGLLILAGFLIVAFYKWISGGSRSPDPWDQESFALPPDEEATVLCHRCLVPNSPGADFCENCGAPVGEYTNYLPFPYLFSVGYLLRSGTSGEFKRTRFTVLGFVILSLAEYAFFAPVYLYQFFMRGLARKPSPPSS